MPRGLFSGPPEAEVRLLAALRRALGLVKGSRNSSWSPDTAGEIAWYLERWIDKLESGDAPDRTVLNELFLPTGPIQETAMANGWGDEFLELAKAVDAYVGESS